MGDSTCENKTGDSTCETKMGDSTCENISIIPPCRCIPGSHAIEAIDYEKLEENTSPKIRILDFGEVLPGAEITKTIDITSNQDQQSLFYIHRKSYVNNIYQWFHFNKYNVTLNPHSSVQLKITYNPLIEHDNSSDCFQVFTRDSSEMERIYLKGRCLGTSIKCSTKKLFFIVTPKVKRRVNTFELRNISKVPATFQFEVNENEELFQVDIVNGQIQPKKSVYITVTFNGKYEGVHYKRLVVLIYKHEPIMVDLLGVYNKNKEYSDDPTNLTFYPKEGHSGYYSYFYDYAFSEENLYPFKLNQSYIDFGRVLARNYGKEKSNSNISVVIVKNNMQQEIVFKWYKDPDNIFIIFPCELKIKPDESGYFEVSFNPDFKDHMYFKMIFA
ncbi:hypothetical protein HHI36_008268, partial [Cryptolaemus montrouzieri]